jgi:hypothetical protein
MGKNLLFVVISCLMLLASVEGLLRWLDIGDPPVFEEHPDYGYLMQPNQSVSTRGHRFHINRAGFRGDDFAWAKSGDIYRIAFVGDSITYGGGSIMDPDLFVNRVASRLSALTHNKIEAMNLSAPGWGIQNIGAYIETVGLPEVDLLVWVIPAVDFRRPKTSLGDHHLPHEKPWSRVTFAFFSLAWVAQRRGSQWFAESHTNSSGHRTIREQNIQVLMHVLTDRMKKGHQVVVAFVPSRKENDWDRDDLVVFRLAAESHSIAWLDLGPALERESLEKVFRDEMHLNNRGHEVVGEGIVGFLMKTGFPGRGD